MPTRSAPLVRYGVAVGTTLVATVLSLAFEPVISRFSPYLTDHAAERGSEPEPRLGLSSRYPG